MRFQTSKFYSFVPDVFKVFSRQFEAILIQILSNQRDFQDCVNLEKLVTTETKSAFGALHSNSKRFSGRKSWSHLLCAALRVPTAFASSAYWKTTPARKWCTGWTAGHREGFCADLLARWSPTPSEPAFEISMGQRFVLGLEPTDLSKNLPRSG